MSESDFDGRVMYHESSRAPRQAPEIEHPQQPKRPRRGAAALAMQQMNSGGDDSNLIETIRGIHASDDIPVVNLDEESSASVEGGSAQQKTIKRLEADVDRLKRNAIQDKATIEQLKTVAERAVESARKKPAAAVDNAFSDLIVDLSCALVQKHIEALELSERLRKTEAKLVARHNAAVPMCGICRNHNATVLLHSARGSEASAQHWFCYDCVSRYAVVNRLVEPDTKLHCPMCKETVETLPPIDIATIATNSIDTWLLQDSDVSQRAFTSFRPQDCVAGLRTFMSALSVPTSTCMLERGLNSKHTGSVIKSALDRCVSTLSRAAMDDM